MGLIKSKSISFLNKLKSKGAFHVIVGSFLINILNFFGSIVLVRVVSKETFGYISYIENIYNYFFIFAGLGLGQGLLRYLVLAKSSQEKYNLYHYSISKGSIFNIIYSIVVIAICVFYPHPPEFEVVRWMLLISLIGIPFQYIKDTSLYTFRGLFENKKYALFALIVSIVLISGKIISGYLWDYEGVIYTKVIITIILALILIIIVKFLFFKNEKATIIPAEQQKDISKYSFHYMLTNALWKIFLLNDLLLLGLMIGDPNVIADYKVAYVLPATIIIINNAIGVFVGPYFVKHETDKKWIMKHYRITMIISTLILGIVAIVVAIFAEAIIKAIYGREYLNVVNLMQLLLVAAFINGALRYMTAHLLSSMGHVKKNLKVSLMGVILQIILNLILIPTYGVIGVAYTSIFVYSLMAICLFVVFIRTYKTK